MRVFGLELSISKANIREDMQVRDSGISSLTNPEEWLLQAILGRVASATGVTVTPLRMMGIATCYACVRVLSTAIASIPLILRQRSPDGGYIEARSHRLYSFMSDAPNKEMSGFDFMRMMQGQLSLRENAFAEIMRDGDGDVAGLYPIDPMDITMARNPKDMELWYRFMRNGSEFRPEDMLHIKGYSRSGLVGLDMSTNLQEVFALAIALQDNAAKFFGNGCRPNGVLEHPASLSPDAQERLKNQFEASTSGRNQYRIALLEEGMKYVATRMENTDAQFQEARTYQDQQICAAFGVPLHKVCFVQSAPRANVEQENISFVVDTMRAICVNWEKALNMKLLTREEQDQGYGFWFDLDQLMRGDAPSRYGAYMIGRNCGFLSANDIRRKEGMNPISGGDVYWQPVNMVDARYATAMMLAGKLSTDQDQAQTPEQQPAQQMGPDGKPIPGQAPAKPAKKVPELDPANPPTLIVPKMPDLDEDTGLPVDGNTVHPPLLKKPKKIAVLEDSSYIKP